MRSARWHTSPLPYEKSLELAKALGVSEIMATVLARRGYDSPEAALRFLDDEGELHNPFLFPEMRTVCDRLRKAVSSKEQICIHGDYDVDGITSTALLQNVLEGLGAKVKSYLPNRFRDGYGVTPRAIEKIAGEGASLLITVDCGITSRSEIALARRLGLETIVIDHHRPIEETLPQTTIISPLLCDYPFKELAGVGLAFKVAQALLGQEGEADNVLPDRLREQLDLVALGTIADVVRLTGENRSLVKRGLVQLARTQRPGLKALMEVGRADPMKLSAGIVAFRLAPRINASGRLDDPRSALELLLAEDDASATELAGHLDSLNRERQRIENTILAQAEEMINGWPDQLRQAKGYVLSSPGWHEGVIGIVASKMVELHYRPVMIIAEGERLGKGSGRSIPAFGLHEALTHLGDMLAAFGGHSAACGLTIELEHIDEFRRGFIEYAEDKLEESDLHPLRYVDALVTGRELTLELARELSMLEPFGLGNPSVDLLATSVLVKNGRRTRDGQHLTCQVASGGVTAGAIGFRQGFLAEKVNGGKEWDVIFRLEQNEFNGSISPQLNLRELIARAPGSLEMPPGLCTAGCDYTCRERVSGEEFWDLVLKPGSPGRAERFLERIYHDSKNETCLWPEERIIDRRGSGAVPSQVTRLAATGQGVLVLVSDVPRRRHLLSHDLPLANLDVPSVALAGGRCGLNILMNRINALDKGPCIMVADFATVLGFPLIAARFPHLALVDPPPCKAVLKALAAAAPEAMLHLFYCRDEVQFTSKVLEHEFDVRAPLARIYRQLGTGNAHPLDETTERLLLAGGKYLRQPAFVARCLNILEELSLLHIEERGGKPILILPENGKTDLKKSPTYRAVELFYKECQEFLSKSLNKKPI